MQIVRLTGPLVWFTIANLAIAADATQTPEKPGANGTKITVAMVDSTAQTIVCPNCGQKMPATANFCSNCGTNLEYLHVATAEASPAKAEKNRPFWPFWEFFFPSSKTTESSHGSALSDKPSPLKLEGFPERPKPIIEIGQNPFLGSGPIAPGFTLPTGAVWQPDFIVYGTARMAMQTFDSGLGQITEWANRLDLYGNLFLTPTERILIGFRPVDKEALNSDSDALRFSGYRFQPHDGPQNGLNAYVTTLFFEGEFSELFPDLESSTGNLDYSFAIGRQPLSFQDGIMINEDLIDAIGVTRTSLFALGASSLRTTALFAWDQLNRNNNVRDNSAKLFGLFTTADYAKTTVDFDLAFVTAPDHNGGDGFYVGLGSTQRLGLINSTFRVNSSVALDKETPAVSTGTLLFTELSTTLPESKNIVYLDAFWGIDNYASAARGPAAGGPLGQTGILFAAQGLGSYGAPLGNRANNSAGAAIGYQIFLGGTDRQLTFELGGRATTSHVRFFEASQPNSIALGTNYQMKMGQHSVLILGGFVGFPEDRSTAYGLRSEWLLKF